MTITEAEKAQIIDYLGYPAQQWVITWLNQRINLLPNIEFENRIKLLLTQITNLETNRQDYILNNSGKQIDGNTKDSYYQGQGENDYIKTLNSYINRISQLLDMPINNNRDLKHLRL